VRRFGAPRGPDPPPALLACVRSVAARRAGGGLVRNVLRRTTACSFAASAEKPPSPLRRGRFGRTSAPAPHASAPRRVIRLGQASSGRRSARSAALRRRAQRRRLRDRFESLRVVEVGLLDARLQRARGAEPAAPGVDVAHACLAVLASWMSANGTGTMFSAWRVISTLCVPACSAKTAKAPRSRCSRGRRRWACCSAARSRRPSRRSRSSRRASRANRSRVPEHLASGTSASGCGRARRAGLP